jgi:hypothetical protein
VSGTEPWPGLAAVEEIEPNQWLWARLDRARAAQLWAELTDWVRWLRETYALKPGQVPDCWYRHPAVMEELTALMAAHKAAYPDAAGSDEYRSALSHWHTYEFWPVIERLRRIGGFDDCDSHQCRYVAPQVRTMPGLGEFAAADVDARPSPPAATPLPPSRVDATVEIIRTSDMQAALAAGLAELVDPADRHGPVRFEDAHWIYSSTRKGYVKQRR